MLRGILGLMFVVALIVVTVRLTQSLYNKWSM